jgi:hypothetical protein
MKCTVITSDSLLYMICEQAWTRILAYAPLCPRGPVIMNEAISPASMKYSIENVSCSTMVRHRVSSGISLFKHFRDIPLTACLLKCNVSDMAHKSHMSLTISPSFNPLNTVLVSEVLPQT